MRPPLFPVQPVLAGALLAWIAAGCCVAPPRAQDLFAVGFRTPEQAFASFQTAVRADDPGLERSCLSSGFIAEHRLSEQVFRIFWEEIEKEEPYLRKGIVDARITGAPEVRGERARIRAVSHGRSLVVDLLREDFCEAWSGGEKVADESAPFGERTGTQAGADGTTWAYGTMPLPPGTLPDRLTELRVGREWKIDGFHMAGERPPDGKP